MKDDSFAIGALIGVGALVWVIIFGGCSVAPSDEFIKALAADPATVCVQVNTIYGRGVISRTNITNGNVQCNADGLTVKSDSSTVTVPVLTQPGYQLTPVGK